MQLRNAKRAAKAVEPPLPSPPRKKLAPVRKRAPARKRAALPARPAAKATTPVQTQPVVVEEVEVDASDKAVPSTAPTSTLVEHAPRSDAFGKQLEHDAESLEEYLGELS